MREESLFGSLQGRLAHTGPTRELGGDIDAFEERLAMLTQSARAEPAGLHFRAT